MMMTQEQAFLKSREQLQALLAFVEEASAAGQRIDKVERELFSQLLLIGHSLLTGFVAAQGDGDAGPTWEHAGRELTQVRDFPRSAKDLGVIWGCLFHYIWIWSRRRRRRGG